MVTKKLKLTSNKAYNKTNMALQVARPELQLAQAESPWGPVDYTTRPAAKPTDEVPIVIIKGFCGIPEAYQDFQDGLSDLGRHAVNPYVPRSLPLPHELHPGNLLHPHRLASYGTKAVMKDLHDNFGVEQFDLLVHSKGGRDVMWVANHLSEYIRSVIFMGSVGTGHNHLWDFPDRIVNFGRREIPAIAKFAWEKKSWRLLGSFVNHVAIRPHRTIGEVLTIHDANLRGRIQALGFLGVNTAVLEMANDTLIPPEDTDPKIIAEADLHETFETGKAIHAAPITQPREVANQVVKIFEQLKDPDLPKRGWAA